MKAAVLTAYGPPDRLRIEERERPVPKDGEVLVRVVASTVTAGDAELRTMKLPWLFLVPLRLWLGLRRPKPDTVLGMELAGVVEATGKAVTQFQVGDEVVSGSGMGFGGNAEYICVSATGTIAHKPASLSFEQVAPLPIGGLAALGYLRKGGIAAGQSVLVRGATGSIGTYAVQLARHFGARVTAVCGSAGVERMRGIGADEVIDYTERDWTANGNRYDLIVDVVGRMSIAQCVRSLSPGGAYVRCTVPGGWEVLQALWFKLASRKRVVLGDAGESAADLVYLAGLVAQGTVETVIDRRFDLTEIAEAHRYVETGHKQGHVVINVS